MSASKDNYKAALKASNPFSGPGKRMNDGWDNLSDRERRSAERNKRSFSSPIRRRSRSFPTYNSYVRSESSKPQEHDKSGSQPK